MPSEPSAPLPLEPFRIKAIERIRCPSPAEREEALRRGGYNLFNLTSDEVFIDLLTDSGTSAMSDRQWAALMVGDESYAGSRNFEHFQQVVRGLTGFPYVIPTHQGRAAENILLNCMAHQGQKVPNNMHFDTTEAHVRRVGAIPVNLAIAEAYVAASDHPFKGNMDLARLERLLQKEGGNVPLVFMTLTNNTGGGQPASLENLAGVSRLCHRFKVPFFLDMCRWAENAFFIRERERGRGDQDLKQIGHDIFDLADGATMSAKKDGLVNIGGFVAARDAGLAQRLKEQLILFEGFPTYGGLARRDLEAMAIGLEEATDLSYMEHRVGQIRYLAHRLEALGIPFVRPPGGHAIYLDAHGFLPLVPRERFPGQALAIELYREGGIRCCEVGGVMFGDKPRDENAPAAMELVRLAIPRRVYTASHLAYVADAIARVWARRADVYGVRIVEAPERLRHFMARFEPCEPPPRTKQAGPTRASARGRRSPSTH